MANEFNIKNGFISNNNSIVQGSLIATSISAITYYNLPTDIFSGGTVSGETFFTNGLRSNTISATTYYNLPTDIKVTGSSFNPATYDLTLTRNDGITLTSNLSILSSDMTVTGGTYDINSGVVTFTNNSGGTFNVSGFASGYTDTYTTGGTYSNGTTVFTKTNGETYDVSGYTTPFTGGTVNELMANTISATTYLNLPINYWSLSGTNIINNNPSGITIVHNTTNSGGLYSTAFKTQYRNNGVLTDGFSVANGGNVNAAYVYSSFVVSTNVGADTNTYLNFGSGISVSRNTNQFTHTSGTVNGFSNSVPFVTVTGNGIYNLFNVAPTINQTGGASGITRGLYINPTLTSAYDFRAIEVIAGKVIVPTAVNSNEAVNKGQLETYTTAQLAGKMNNPSLTASYIPKALTSTSIGNSRLLDTNTYLGIGTVNTPTKDITLGNQLDREIGIELSNSTTIGRNLMITAGNTINYQLNSNFLPQSQLLKAYEGIDVDSNGNVWVCEADSSAIYKQTGGIGNFIVYSTANSYPRKLTVAPNGDIYVSTWAGGSVTVRVQTGGAGAWNTVTVNSIVGSGQGDFCSAANGDVYFCTNGTGQIYMRAGGVGNFVSLAQTSLSWTGLAYHFNGDVYACASGGDIYRQTGGIGNFVGLSQTSRNWSGISIAPNGNIYASVANGDIYMQTSGMGAFEQLSQTSRNWSGLAAHGNGNVYAIVYSPNSDIYIQNNAGVGTADLQGGKLKLNSGTGKGSGDSSIEMWTGQVLSAGTDMQTATLRAKIDNTGLMTLPSVTNALISADTTGKAVVTKEYLNNRLVVETTTGYTLTNVDSGGIVIFKTMSAQTLNIPLLLTDGFECTFVTLSGVTLTVPAVAGITLNNATGTLLPPQSSFTLKRMIAANTFIATGNL